MLDNPFTYGNPISNPQRFIGRRREIEQAFSRLLSAEGESTSIVGERRWGTAHRKNIPASLGTGRHAEELRRTGPGNCGG